jgi:hypothetical protein
MQHLPVPEYSLSKPHAAATQVSSALSSSIKVLEKWQK